MIATNFSGRILYCCDLMLNSEIAELSTAKNKASTVTNYQSE